MQAISHESILKMGPYRGLDIASGNAELATELYRSMVRLRRCEEAIIEEYHPADEIRCPVHFCVGQEAAPPQHPVGPQAHPLYARVVVLGAAVRARHVVESPTAAANAANPATCRRSHRRSQQVVAELDALV